MTKKRTLFILTFFMIVLNSCGGGGGGLRPSNDNDNAFSTYIEIPDEFIDDYIGEAHWLLGKKSYVTISASVNGFSFTTIFSSEPIVGPIDDDKIKEVNPLIRPFLNNNKQDDLPSFYRLGGNKNTPNGDPKLPNYNKIIEFHSRGGKALFVLKNYDASADAKKYEFISVNKDTGELGELYIGNLNTPSFKIDYPLEGGVRPPSKRIRTKYEIAYTLDGGLALSLWFTTVKEDNY